MQKIDVNEAVKLGGFMTVDEARGIIEYAQNILRTQKSNRANLFLIHEDLLFLMATLYNAGVVAGVRKERAKR